MTTSEDNAQVTVTRTETASVRIAGLGKVDVEATDGATVESVLRVALKKLGANESAVKNLFPVLNGEDVDKPAETPVTGEDRVTAMPKTENG